MITYAATHASNRQDLASGEVVHRIGRNASTHTFAPAGCEMGSPRFLARVCQRRARLNIIDPTAAADPYILGSLIDDRMRSLAALLKRRMPNNRAISSG